MKRNGQRNGLYRKVLPNGLTVLIQEKETRSTAIAIGIRFGSTYHPLAHFIGHMLFNGTERRTYRDINRGAIKGGGLMDEVIDLYSTIYFIKGISEYAHQALDLLCDMIKNSTLPPKEYEYEKLVIKEELTGRNEDPRVILKNRLYKILYKNIETGVTQDKDSLEKLTRDQVYDVYRQFYVPERLVIAIVGRINREKAMRIINKYFGKAKGGVLVPFGQRPERPISGSKRIILKKSGLNQTHLMLGFRTPRIFYADYYTLLILQTIIAGNIGSRLYEQLREKRGLLYNITAKLDCSNWHGMLRFYTNFSPGNLPIVEKIIEKEFGKLSRTLVSKEELKTAKLKLVRERQLDLEDTLQHAQLLVDAEINGQLKKFKLFSARIKKVTARDILRIAKRHCDFSKSVVIILKARTKKNR